MVVRLTTLYYDLEDSIDAAEVCKDLDEAEKYLRQECELCATVMRPKEVIHHDNEK